MSTFQLRTDAARPPDRLDTAEGSKAFRPSVPIGDSVDDAFMKFPWQQSVTTFKLSHSKAATPWAAAVVVVRPGENARVATDYVAQATEEMPDDLRADLMRGIGMFRFPLGQADADDLYE